MKNIRFRESRRVPILIALPIVFLLAGIQRGACQDFQAPHLTQYATDLSGTLTPAQIQTLNQKLSAFDRSTSTQVIVLIVPTMGQGSVEEAALQVAEANGIGRKGKDNGALLFVAMRERQVRIEVGYGLEGALPDALAGLIIRRELAPQFSGGKYFAGIDAAVDAIMAATKNEYQASPEDLHPVRKNPMGFLVIPLFLLFAFLRLARFWSPFGRRRGGFWWWGGFPSSGGWGGGSIGGGSFGGFSGGGGSFGGGGASGSW